VNVGLAAGLAAASTESGQLHAALRANEGLAARAANAEAAASRLPALTASNAALTLRVDNLQKAHDCLQVREAIHLLCRRQFHVSAIGPSICHIITPGQDALSRRTARAQQVRMLHAVMNSSSDVTLVPTAGEVLRRRRRIDSRASSWRRPTRRRSACGALCRRWRTSCRGCGWWRRRRRSYKCAPGTKNLACQPQGMQHVYSSRTTRCCPQ